IASFCPSFVGRTLAIPEGVSGGHVTQRELIVVDCSQHHTGVPFYFEEPGPEERANAVWRHIDDAFAEPMTRSDNQADYTATQILAELFKHAGLDGVVYRSNCGPDGFNIALFDPGVAELVNCGLYKTRAMQPDFVEADPFYTVAAKGGAG
ncbi:MAG: RES family NAD+ phosphorylase, partial [Caulobacteraceae bacterium]|nr:RES family NAD+ phosphorylase [Caulobacteraceae bacterium]